MNVASGSSLGSGSGIGGMNHLSRGSGDTSSSGRSGDGGDTHASAGELIVLACMVCSYGLIGAGLLHTVLVLKRILNKSKVNEIIPIPFFSPLNVSVAPF
jgi:hypothetical protein